MRNPIWSALAWHGTGGNASSSAGSSSLSSWWSTRFFPEPTVLRSPRSSAIGSHRSVWSCTHSTRRCVKLPVEWARSVVWSRTCHTGISWERSGGPLPPPRRGRTSHWPFVHRHRVVRNVDEKNDQTSELTHAVMHRGREHVDAAPAHVDPSQILKG